MVITAQNINKKLGYKQTEVGVIPEDWEVKNLGDIADVIMGQSPVGTSYNRKEFGVPLINGPTEFTDKYPVKIQWTTEPTKISQKGDLLLCVRGSSTGRINISNDNYCIGRGIAVIRAKAETDTTFITYVVLNAVHELLSLTTGSTFPNIDGKTIKTIELAYPSIAEQTAIATVLSDTDSLITLLDKLIAKKRDIKQATMQQLLTGKTQLPGFSKVLKPTYKQTEMGIIPSEWEICSLGDLVAKVGSGITPTGGEKVYKKEGRPFLRSQNVGWGYLLLDDIVFIDEETHKSFLATEIKLNDVLLNITGASIGRSAVVDNRLLGGNVNQHVCIIRVNTTKFSPYFLNFFLLTEIGQKQIQSFQAGGNRQGLNFGQIKSFQIPLPSLLEQTAITAVLSDMDAEITALEQKRDKIRALKQGMMQELLTGKTRLL